MEGTPDGSVAGPQSHEAPDDFALRLGEVADNIPALISYIDAGLYYRYVNRTYTEWFLTEKENVIGKHMQVVLGDNAYSSLLPELSRVLAGETITFEKFLAYRHGGPRNVLVTYIPDRQNGNIRGFFAVVLDLSDRKPVDTALLENFIIQAMALSSGKLGVFECDLATDTVWWSSEQEEIFGLAPGEFGGTEADFYSYVYEDDRERLWDEVNSAIKERRPYEIQFRIKRRDGQLRWLKARAEAVYSESGEAVRLYGTSVDITADKEREIAVRQSEANLRDFFESATVAMHWVDTDGVIIWANKAELDMLGYTKDEFVGHSVRDFHIDPSEIDDVFAALQRGEIVAEKELRLRHKDGRTCYGLVNASGHWEEGKLVHTRCFTRDITNQKLADRKLRESEERFRLALSSGAVTVYEQDRDLRYKWVYPLSPYPQDIIGKTDRELSPGPDADLRTELKQRVLETGKNIRRDIRASVRGEQRSYDLLIEPRLSADGEVIGIVGTALDITQQKKAAAELAETVRRQSALYHLSDRLNRAAGLNEIYEGAIDAILEALGCDRVSILLYDDSNVMRFVGWKGISDGYRSATEGHSPWTPDTVDPEPIAVNDLANEEMEAGLKGTILAEGIRALCFIPLVSNGRLIGKFMIYFDEPHEFTESEINLSLTISRQLSFGIARQRADSEIRESESRFRNVADAAPVLIWQSDVLGNCTWVNKPWLEFTGQQIDEVTGDGWAELIHPEDRDRAVATFVDSRNARKEFWMEYRLLRHDGEYRWLLDHGVPRFTESSEFVGYIGSCIDITERLDIERELRASEERYRGIVDQTVAGVAEIALDNTFVTVNDRFCEIVGYTPRELLSGMKKSDLIHPDDLETSTAKIAELHRTGLPFEMEKRYLTKDCKVVWVNNSVSAVRDAEGRPISVAIVVIDITVRKEAEAALRESEERFAKAFSASPLIFTLASLVDGRLVEVNEAFTAITGYAREEAIGRTTADLGLWADAADRDDELRQLHSFGRVHNREYRFRTREGDEVIGLLSAERVEIGGEPFALTVIQDITERKREEVNREFLLQIGEAIRASTEVTVLMETVLKLLGSHIKADRCFFGEVDLDAEVAFVEHEFRSDPDARSYCGAHALSEFSPSTRSIVEAGDTVRVDNVDLDERLRGDRQNYQSRGVGAYISTPLMRSGRLAATLWVNKSGPYHWSDWEADLVRAVAERTWLAVEKLRSEAHLRESEARFRDLANAMPQLVWTADPDGKVDYYNSSAAKYGNLAQSAADGEWNWQVIVHPDDRDLTTGLWSEAQSSGFYECEHRIRMKDGSFRWHLSRATAVRDPKDESVVKWFGTATDIHDQKTAQEAVNRAERQAAQEYRALLSRIVPLAQTLGTSRDLISIYRSLREFVSTSMPCSGFFISFYDPAASTRVAAYAWGEDGEVNVASLPSMPLTRDGGPNAQAVFGRKPVVTRDYMKVMSDRPHLVIGTGGGDPQSSLCVPMIVMNKLIGTIEVQSSLADAFTEEHVVALEMVANLAAAAIENVRIIEIEAAARQAAEAANQMKDEFLSVLSHELRTPLNSMLGWIRMLRTGMLEGEHVDKAMEVIERNTHQQSGLIEDLLDVSRIISGKMRIEPEPTDLRPIVQEGVEAHRPIAIAKEIDLQYSAADKPMIVEVDPLRLQQVVSNLVQNAIKFSSKGGAINVLLESDSSGGAIIRVRDNGIGIEPEFLPHIFDRFRQADASAKRSFAGLGLGLTIVRKIVELHGGTITADSSGADLGAEFTVRLPGAVSRLAPPSKTSAAAEPDSLNGISGKRILLVDDDPDSLVPLKLMLEQKKAVAEPVDSAHKALERLVASEFDVLVSDIGMPEMDGLDLIKAVRSLADPSAAGLPAIAITAYASSENRRDVLDAGYHAHLAKPIDFDELVKTIESVLDRNGR